MRCFPATASVSGHPAAAIARYPDAAAVDGHPTPVDDAYGLFCL